MPHTPSASVLLNRLQAKARFRHLQVLVRLGELNSIRRTADALGLSQPAVTQCLADLERLVELRLFDRHARGLRVTRAGSEVLPLARRMLDALAETSEALTAARLRSEGVVRVAAITGAVGWPAGAGAACVCPGPPGDHGACSRDGARTVGACSWPEGPWTWRWCVNLRPRRPGSTSARCRRTGSWSSAARRTRWRGGRTWPGRDWPTAPGCRRRWVRPAREVLDRQMAQIGVQPRTVQVLTRASSLTVALVEIAGRAGAGAR